MLLHEDLTYKLNGIFFAVHNDLGRHRNEQQYCDAIEAKLQEKNILYYREYRIPQSFQGERSGRNIADFLVGDSVIVEIKAVPRATREHYHQVKRYLAASGHTLGILVNFKRYHLKPKRILYPHQHERNPWYPND